MLKKSIEEQWRDFMLKNKSIEEECIDFMLNLVYGKFGDIKIEMHQRRNGKKFAQEFVKNNRKSK